MGAYNSAIFFSPVIFMVDLLLFVKKYIIICGNLNEP